MMPPEGFFLWGAKYHFIKLCAWKLNFVAILNQWELAFLALYDGQSFILSKF